MEAQTPSAAAPQPAPEPTPAKLSYEPSAAAHMQLIQSSFAQLSAAELALFNRQGFVIAQNQRFPSYTYGYASIYAADLPVFISADSILDAMHRSYDAILSDLEVQSLSPELAALLAGLRTKLASGSRWPVPTRTSSRPTRSL